MQKQLIAQHFDQAACFYDRVANIQELVAQELAHLVDRNDINSILDIGCGTGKASLALYKKHPSAEYTLCDISQNMLKVARDVFPTYVHTICCDAEYYDFARYDLIVSNLCMQWFASVENFIAKIQEKCDLFVFSTLVDTSFESYKSLFETPPTFVYPSAEELIYKCGLQRYKVKRYTMQFENMFGVVRYFRMLGAHLKSTNCATKLPLNNHPITIEYDVLIAAI